MCRGCSLVPAHLPANLHEDKVCATLDLWMSFLETSIGLINKFLLYFICIFESLIKKYPTTFQSMTHVFSSLLFILKISKLHNFLNLEISF